MTTQRRMAERQGFVRLRAVRFGEFLICRVRGFLRLLQRILYVARGSLPCLRGDDDRQLPVRFSRWRDADLHVVTESRQEVHQPLH